jgi:copper chaperone CopZ
VKKDRINAGKRDMPEKKVKTNKKTSDKKKKKIRIHRTSVIFWICLALVLTPFAILGWILVSASMDTGSPVIGNRYEGDLDPAITKDQMNDVEAAVKKIDGVDDSFVTMTTATLRVYADVSDSADEATCDAEADSIYTAVSSVLDPSVYFTKTDSEKMYDLEIHVYTIPERTDADGENFVYVIDTKTSNMTDPAKQTVSVAKDQAVADQLRADVETRKAEAAAAASASAAADSSSGVTGTDGDTEGQ